MPTKRGRGRETSYSRAQILSEWERIKDAPDEELTAAYAKKNYEWWSSACSIFGKSSCDWYGFLKAMGKDEEGIRRIREIGKKSSRRAVTERNTRYSREEVLAEWEKVKDAPDEELTAACAIKNYEWWSSACTHFSKKRGWYGFLAAMGKTSEQIESIRNAAMTSRGPGARYSREEVLAEWEKVKDAPDEELTLTYAQKNYEWRCSACTHFGGPTDNWYVFLRAMGKSDEGIAAIRKAGERGKARKLRESKLAFSKEEVLAEWEKIKDAPDEELTYAYATKNYGWWSSAGSLFGRKKQDWYGFLEAMGVGDDRLVRIRNIAIATRGKTKYHTRRKKKGKTFTREEVLAEWEKVKDAPDEELTLGYARKNYEWFSSACTIFGKHNSDWYGFLKAMGKSDEGIAAIREAGKKGNIMRLRESRLSFSKEEILAEWERIEDAPHKELTLSYAKKNYRWWASACSHFGGPRRNWYVFLRAMGKGEAEVEDIRETGKEIGTRAAWDKKLKYSKEEVLAEWEKIKDAPDEELTYKYARQNYPWLNSACTIFGGPTNNWYVFLRAMGKSEAEVRGIKLSHRKSLKVVGIPKYSKARILAEWERIKDAPDRELTLAYAKENYRWFHSACSQYGKSNEDWYGFLSAMGKTEQQIAGIRDAAVQAAREAMAKYTREEVLAEWEKVKDAPDEELTWAYARQNYPWFSPACTQIGGKPSDWYGFLSEVGKTDEDIQRIREVGKKKNLESARESSLRFTKDEILAEWEKVKDAPDEELTYAYARKNYEWFYSACSHYGKRNDDWYGFLRAMGKTDGEVGRIRQAGRRASVINRILAGGNKTSDGRTIVIIDSENQNGTSGNGTDYSKAVGTINSPGIISTRTHSAKVVRFSLSLEEGRAGRAQSKAEQIRRMIGSGVDWDDPGLAQGYKAVFPQMAPWVVHRACMLHLLGLAKAGEVAMPRRVLSAASGPSEVHEAIADLRAAFREQGIPMPEVHDLDLSMNMLLTGDNRSQSVGDAKRMGFRSGVFDMVENSSIFQFGPQEVKGILLESNRVLKEGGYLLLVSNGKRFADSFYAGLEECGFGLLSEKDAMFGLCSGGRRLLGKAHGKRFAQKFKSALGDSVFILAEKVLEADEQVDAGLFRFESFDSAPPELRAFLDEFRGFLKGVSTGDVEETKERRKKAIAAFKDIGERKPDIFTEYSTVFNRAQEKFWSVVSSSGDLEPLRDRDRKREGAFPATWRLLPVKEKGQKKMVVGSRR